VVIIDNNLNFYSILKMQIYYCNSLELIGTWYKKHIEQHIFTLELKNPFWHNSPSSFRSYYTYQYHYSTETTCLALEEWYSPAGC